ncbi:MAG: DUF1499 domain-containing protein [Gemmatimonadetes bacterium]|nr:DUF1499 domain-containing protein [Gemmatimonadota bacterium]
MAAPPVRTGPDAADPRLRGRTYAIPFEDVWQGTLRLVRGKLRGWSLEFADDREGVVNARVATRLKWFHGVIEVRVGLDADAQTRVDASSATPDAFHDLGLSARRLRQFFQALDREAVREHQRRLPDQAAPR